MLSPTQQAKIKELLLASSAKHLADCLEMVPEDIMHGLHRMIWDERDNRQPIAVSIAHVEYDVAAVVGGYDVELYCKPFLNFN